MKILTRNIDIDLTCNLFALDRPTLVRCIFCSCLTYIICVSTLRKYMRDEVVNMSKHKRCPSVQQ